MCEFKEVRLCLEVTDRNNNMSKTTIVEINGHRFVREQRYEQLERILKDMWRWVRKTAYAEQGYLTISELKEYARQFKECGVILDD